MKDTIFIQPGQVAIEEVAKPSIQAPDDVIIHVLRACVCGSDLWGFRGQDDKPEHSQNSGHEAIGVVEAVGSAITTLVPGDFVIAPFTHGCGHCAACRAGYEGGCLNHTDNFSNGAQAEYMRYQHGEWALVKVPGKPADYSEAMLKSLLALEFGATDIVEERGDDGVARVMTLTQGVGADAVLECVGTTQAVTTAVQIGRPGATVGRVGVPHDAKMDLTPLFYRNTKLAGGPASVTTYDKQRLLEAVLQGTINPGKVFTQTFTLDDIQAAYEAMDQRKAIKSYLIVTQ